MHPVSVTVNKTRKVRLFMALSLCASLSIISGCAAVEGVRGQISSKLGGNGKTSEQAATAVPTMAANESLTGQIQERLKQLGYKPGPVTGKPNSRTEAAIQDFQLDKDLRVDGRVSVKLLESLNNAITEQSSAL